MWFFSFLTFCLPTKEGRKKRRLKERPDRRAVDSWCSIKGLRPEGQNMVRVSDASGIGSRWEERGSRGAWVGISAYNFYETHCVSRRNNHQSLVLWLSSVPCVPCNRRISRVKSLPIGATTGSELEERLPFIPKRLSPESTEWTHLLLILPPHTHQFSHNWVWFHLLHCRCCFSISNSILRTQNRT